MKRSSRTAVIVLLATSGLMATPDGSLLGQEPGVLVGTVTDARTQRPLPGVRIDLTREDPAQRSVHAGYTDADGRYRFELPEGLYVVRTAIMGYALRTDTLQVPAGTTVDHPTMLMPAPLPLDDVIRVPVRPPPPPRCEHYSECLHLLRQHHSVGESAPGGALLAARGKLTLSTRGHFYPW